MCSLRPFYCRAWEPIEVYKRNKSSWTSRWFLVSFQMPKTALLQVNGGPSDFVFATTWCIDFSYWEPDVLTKIASEWLSVYGFTSLIVVMHSQHMCIHSDTHSILFPFLFSRTLLLAFANFFCFPSSLSRSVFVPFIFLLEVSTLPITTYSRFHCLCTCFFGTYIHTNIRTLITLFVSHG